MASEATFRRGTVDEGLLFGLDDLIHLNWEEVETDHAEVPLAVNWTGYRDLERRGILKPLYVFKDGALIGYAVWFVNEPLHHAQTKWAINDLIWIDPAHRRGTLGLRLLAESEAWMRELGAKVITINAKLEGVLSTGKPRASVATLLSRIGYREAEKVMMKVI